MQDVRRAMREAAELAARGRLEQAVAVLRRAVQKDSGSAEAARALAQLLLRAGELGQALFYAERAAAIGPGVSSWMTLSAVHHVRKDAAAAVTAAVKAAEAAPGSFEVQSNLGVCLAAVGEFARAERAMRRAVEVAPEADAGYENLANLLAGECLVEEAIGVLREGMERCPGSAGLRRALCFNLNYSDRAGAADVCAAQDEVGRLSPARALRSHENSRDPGRALRVGFVSPDFQRHVVMRFFEPLLERVDRGAFTALCYSTSPVADDVTARVRSRAAVWVEGWGLSDHALAERIAADGVDVLVDLAGFTTGARPEMFSLCPAPVQVGMIGYPGATGLPAVGHRITDGIADPVDGVYGADDAPVRLGRCFLCYRPSGAEADVAPRGEGPVTFGSFNAAKKVSASCVALWSRVLERVPGSRMVLKSLQFASERARREVLSRAPDPSRFEVLPPSASEAEHLAAYGGVDIALDTLPYCGTTTTCEALWMGVPAVTLAGETHAARVGASVLTGAGLPELVAGSPEEFIEIAAGMAGDRGRLAELRGGLRARVAASALCDETGYARAVEGAIRGLWREWCAGR